MDLHDPDHPSSEVFGMRILGMSYRWIEQGDSKFKAAVRLNEVAQLKGSWRRVEKFHLALLLDFSKLLQCSTYFNLFVAHLLVECAVLRRLGGWHVDFGFRLLVLPLGILVAARVDAVALVISTIKWSICRHRVCQWISSGVGVAAHVFIIFVWLFHRVVLLHILLCTLCITKPIYVRRIYKKLSSAAQGRCEKKKKNCVEEKKGRENQKTSRDGISISNYKTEDMKRN